MPFCCNSFPLKDGLKNVVSSVLIWLFPPWTFSTPLNLQFSKINCLFTKGFKISSGQKKINVTDQRQANINPHKYHTLSRSLHHQIYLFIKASDKVGRLGREAMLLTLSTFFQSNISVFGISYNIVTPIVHVIQCTKYGLVSIFRLPELMALKPAKSHQQPKSLPPFSFSSF